jgi:hypothetical protein
MDQAKVSPVPPLLYKFQPVPTPKHHKAIFTTHQLWFPSPLKFNDPFDRRNRPSFNVTEDQALQYFATYLVERGVSPEDAIAKALVLVANKEHRPTPERIEEAYQAQLATLATMGVYCLSADRASLLMWAHYSDCHKGFCLGFTTTHKPFAKAKEITYARKLPVASFVVDPQDEFIKKMLLTKSREWSYEKEWRIIDDETPGLVQYQADSLVEAIFGLEMKESDKAALRRYAKKGKCQVRFFQARRKRGRYGLTFAEVPA